LELLISWEGAKI